MSSARFPQAPKTCGDLGGCTAAGRPCTRSLGWGTAHPGEGYCKSHGVELTPKELTFIQNYCAYGNGSKAAREAGYSLRSAHDIAFKLLKKAEIRDSISSFLDEHAMSKAEIIDRLSMIARGSVEHFLQREDGRVWVDISDPATERHLPLIKKIRQRTERIVDREGKEITNVYTEIELHDAMAALVHIARIHGMFVDRHEVSGSKGKPVEVEIGLMSEQELRQEIAATIKRLATAGLTAASA